MIHLAIPLSKCCYVDILKMYCAGSFAGLGFLSLYLSGKIRVFDRKGHVAKVCLTLLPLLVASLVGVSRVDDYWHHWQDVFAGGLIGSFTHNIIYSNQLKEQRHHLNDVRFQV